MGLMAETERRPVTPAPSTMGLVVIRVADAVYVYFERGPSARAARAHRESTRALPGRAPFIDMRRRGPAESAVSDDAGPDAS